MLVNAAVAVLDTAAPAADAMGGNGRTFRLSRETFRHLP
jgi:hypothetical protein